MADGSYAIAARNRFSVRYGIHFSRIYGAGHSLLGPACVFAADPLRTVTV